MHKKIEMNHVATCYVCGKMYDTYKSHERNVHGSRIFLSPFCGLCSAEISGYIDGMRGRVEA